MANLLVCRPDLPADVAAAATRVLVQLVPAQTVATQFLDVGSLIGTGTVPLHPGAVETYRALHGRARKERPPVTQARPPVVTMPLRVRFHECDPQGIVFNAHYLAYFDMASFEFFKAIFGSYDGLRERGADCVVAESNLRYRAPSRFDDALVVEVAIDHLGTTSMILAFTIRRGEDLIAEGTNRYVFVDATTLVKAAPPGNVRAKLLAHT